MGPYYFTALVQLLGPARRVSACGADQPRSSARSCRSRCAGELIDVEVPTHVAAAIEFASGPIATLVTSFDVQASRYRNIEVYGTEATLSVPDPNTFGGPVAIRAPRRRGVDRGRPAPGAPPAAAGHRPRRHALGAAHRSAAPRVRRARAPRARAHDGARSLPQSRAGASISRRRVTRAAPLPVGLPGEHLRRLSRTAAQVAQWTGRAAGGGAAEAGGDATVQAHGAAPLRHRRRRVRQRLPPPRARAGPRHRGRRPHVADAAARACRIGARPRARRGPCVRQRRRDGRRTSTWSRSSTRTSAASR